MVESGGGEKGDGHNSWRCEDKVYKWWNLIGKEGGWRQKGDGEGKKMGDWSNERWVMSRYSRRREKEFEDRG